ncbi:hypothetical protein SEUBUCD646_0B03480 [Saccharomyces eubayanus]|nr:hypothetical protein SEUBUCD646_0B03480 [Saccharomyces eubayanus]
MKIFDLLQEKGITILRTSEDTLAHSQTHTHIYTYTYTYTCLRLRAYSSVCLPAYVGAMLRVVKTHRLQLPVISSEIPGENSGRRVFFFFFISRRTNHSGRQDARHSTRACFTVSAVIPHERAVKEATRKFFTARASAAAVFSIREQVWQFFSVFGAFGSWLVLPSVSYLKLGCAPFQWASPPFVGRFSCLAIRPWFLRCFSTIPFS